jgi:hypothetical protein
MTPEDVPAVHKLLNDHLDAKYVFNAVLVTLDIVVAQCAHTHHIYDS